MEQTPTNVGAAQAAADMLEEEALKDYIRVGTTLYKFVRQPLINGDTAVRRQQWNVATLHQDYGKDTIKKIAKYDSFCTVPSHTNFQKVIGSSFNLYEPITHVPQEGDYSHINQLVHHIFGEQYELGMDYLQLLYTNPIQKLPILLLVSSERNTGKSTFLNFLKLMFQDNVTFNTNEDFRSQFNADWAGKLMIVVDEVLLSRKEDSERLKNLSTAHTYKVEAKGKDRTEVQFFAKFVLCSNNEYYPVIIDREEVRYWVRKIPKLESDDTNFLQKLEDEIPAFMHYLCNRTLSTVRASRMWFDPKMIHTDALDRIINCNRSKVEIGMTEVLLDLLDYINSDSISLCINDILYHLTTKQIRAEHQEVRNVLQQSWKLLPAADSSQVYTNYKLGIGPAKYIPEKTKGRYYTITRELLEEHR